MDKLKDVIEEYKFPALFIAATVGTAVGGYFLQKRMIYSVAKKAAVYALETTGVNLHIDGYDLVKRVVL